MGHDEFRTEYEALLGRISRRDRGGRVAEAASYLRNRYPTEPEAHFAYNLVCCLTGHDGGAVTTLRRVRLAEMQCARGPALNRVLGDMYRDAAIAFVELHYPAQTRKSLDQVRKLHAGDANRLGCAKGIEGRLDYALGQFEDACELHAAADREMTDKVWIYLNLIHWLRAAIKMEERDRDLEQQLLRRIRTERPANARNRSLDAAIMRVPVIGDDLYNMARRLIG